MQTPSMAERPLGEERHDVLAALKEFLADKFEAEDLRIFLHTVAPQLSQDLPGSSVTKRLLVEATVDTFERHGAIDERFFAKLQAIRPRHGAEIEAIQRRLTASRTLARSAPTLASHAGPTTADWSKWSRISRTAATLCAIVLAFTRCYPQMDASRALRSVEQGFFGFLPQSYRSLGLIGAFALSIIAAIVFSLLARRTRARTLSTTIRNNLH